MLLVNLTIKKNQSYKKNNIKAILKMHTISLKKATDCNKREKSKVKVKQKSGKVDSLHKTVSRPHPVFSIASN